MIYGIQYNTRMRVRIVHEDAGMKINIVYKAAPAFAFAFYVQSYHRRKNQETYENKNITTSQAIRISEPQIGCFIHAK